MLFLYIICTICVTILLSIIVLLFLSLIKYCIQICCKKNQINPHIIIINNTDGNGDQ